MPIDMETFIKNRQAFPPEELAKYAGQWVAWAADGGPAAAGGGGFLGGAVGGYVGRGRQARPGVRVLWRGLRRLHDRATGYEPAHSLHPQPPPTEQSSVE